MSSSSQPDQLDVSALNQPIDESALTAFIADAKTTGKPWARITTGLPRAGVGDLISQLLLAVIPLLGMLALLYAGGSSLIRAVSEFTSQAPFPLNLVVVGFLALIGLGIIVAFVRVVRLLRSWIIPRWWWEAAYRLTRFAAANGLRYGHDEPASHPGVIFTTGIDRVAERRLTTTKGRRVEIGNYRYTVRGDDRDSSQVFGWGYVAITLDRRLPHLLLDAQANDRSVFGIRRSNLPADLAPDQRLALGGEFDDHFTLYAPSDYGRDAFSIFTPDLMALFIDRLGTFDVEIIDDTMFVYGRRFDLLDPRTYDWLQQLVDTVVARTVRRTERYRDEFALLEQGAATRKPAREVPSTSSGGEPHEAVFALGGDGPPRTATNSIAERGRRLRRRRWGAYSIIGILAICFYLYNEVVAPIFGLPRVKD